MLRLGITARKGTPVELSIDERRQGTYIIGTTGTGKSTLLKNIIVQDMRQDQKHGLCLVDPHGDLVDEVLEMVPEQRIQDVIVFDPTDIYFPFGLNLLACDRKDDVQVRWVVSTVMGTLRRLFEYSWGPRLEHVLRHTLITAMLLPDSTFIELLLLLTNEEFRKEVLAELKDPIIQQFWKDLPSNPRDRYELISSTLNKISPFITDRGIRNIIGQPKNTIDLQDIMDKGKILLVNLSKGDLGEDNSSLLGSMLVNLILMAALKRRSTPKSQRIPFHLIVDEFQNFANESFAVLQSEARKYAVDVVVAHQFRDQLPDELKGSTLNVGNMVVFRTTGKDSYALASQFDNSPPEADKRVEPIYQYYEYKGEQFLVEAKLSTGEGTLYREVELPQRPYSDTEAEMANKLSILPDYQAWCRLIYDPRSRGEKDGMPYLIERLIKTEDLDGRRSKEEVARGKQIAKTIRERSKKLATPRDEVEKAIVRRSFGQIRPDEAVYTFETLE